MLIHPTLAKLEALRLFGMLRALNDQLQLSECHSLSFEERLGLLVDREATERENQKVAARLKRAHLREAAAPEDAAPPVAGAAPAARLGSGAGIG